VITPATLRQIVAEANLAPSVHNTQPTRWHLAEPDLIRLTTATSDQLTVGDPTGHDAALSMGCALEGTAIALARQGLAIAQIDTDGATIHARIIAGDAVNIPHELIETRTTWRKSFAPANEEGRAALSQLHGDHDDVHLLTNADDIAWIAEANDAASLTFFRNRPYRDELVQWMRLSRSHPNWATDGLNADALGLTAVEAFGARVAFRWPIFETLDAIRAAGPLTSEADKTKSATAIALFHRPQEEPSLASGRAFYQFLLGVAQAGMAAWPMAVIADDPTTALATSTRFSLPDDRRLVTAFRIGPIAHDHSVPVKARRDPAALITL
jgi:hypothetical protein